MAAGPSERHQAKAPGADAAGEARRRELLGLFERLRSELGGLPRSDEQARSVEFFAQAVAHEATREHRNARQLKLALEGLKSAVEQFEASHPNLVQTVGAIAALLAGMGI
jgi:hypothetical protein